MILLAGVREGALSVAWYVKGLVGEDAYEKYVAHHASACKTDAAGSDGAPHPLMTEREFWRDQTDRQDQNPQGRCC